MKNLTLKQITGAALVVIGAGYLIMQVMVFAINSSTYM